MKEEATSYKIKALEVWLEIIKLKPCPSFNFPITGISVVPFVFNFVHQKDEGVKAGNPAATEEGKIKKKKTLYCVTTNNCAEAKRRLAPSPAKINEIKGITRQRLLRTNGPACRINHRRKCIIAPAGMQNYSNQYVPTLRDVDYGGRLKRLS